MAGFLAALGPILQGVGALGGLFGKRKSNTQAETVRGILGQAQGAREAAAQYGFNPLTLLQASSPIAGTMSAPPLASLSVLGDIVEDNFGDDATTRKEHNKLQNELLRLEVDRARTLNKVAVAPSWAAAGAVSGGRVSSRVTGPATPFLNELDRNPAVADERDNTVSFQSHGQQTVVPVGPDLDEVLTGVFIEANNKNKAAKARMAKGPMDSGTPLTVPFGFFNRTGELLPGRQSNGKAEPKPKRKAPKYNSSWIQ